MFKIKLAWWDWHAYVIIIIIIIEVIYALYFDNAACFLFMLFVVFTMLFKNGLDIDIATIDFWKEILVWGVVQTLSN